MNQPKDDQEVEDRTVPLLVCHHEEFPSSGVKLSYIENHFYELCGGKKNLEGLTTAEVCEQYIKPATAEEQLSLCELLHRQNHSDVREQAQVFVSHAWKYEFLNVVCALISHFKGNTSSKGATNSTTSDLQVNDPVIWFDLFSNNQHKAVTKPFEFWTNTFKSSIKSLGHTVMVLSPWNNPIPYTRAWCIFEAYATADTGAKFEVAMSQGDKDQFLLDMRRGTTKVINNMLAVIDAEKSECWIADDKERIFQVIRETVGFSTINSMLHKQLRKWVVSIAEEAVRDTCNYRSVTTYAERRTTEEESDDEEDTAQAHHHKTRLLSSLATLYRLQGDFKKAEPIYEAIVRSRRRRLLRLQQQEVIEETCRVLEDEVSTPIASASSCSIPDQGSICQEDEDIAGSDANLLSWTIKSIHSLALTYRLQGNFKDAEPLYKEVLELNRKLHGPDHRWTLLSQCSLAFCYKLMGNIAEAQELYEDGLSRQRAIYGDDDPETLNSAGCLGGVYVILGGAYLEKAQALCEECVARRKKLYDSEGKHPDTIASMNDLANVYKRQGKLELAQSLLEECYHQRMTVIGEWNPRTLVSAHELGVLYEMLDRNEESRLLLSDCWEKRKKSLGESHPSTVYTQCTLADLHYKIKNFALSKELFRSAIFNIRTTCYHKARAKLGLAKVLTAINEFEEAEQLFEEVLAFHLEHSGKGHERYQSVVESLEDMRQKRDDQVEDRN